VQGESDRSADRVPTKSARSSIAWPITGFPDRRRLDGIGSVRYIDTKRLRGSEIDAKIELDRSLHRDIAGLFIFQNLVNDGRGSSENICVVGAVGDQGAVHTRPNNDIGFAFIRNGLTPSAGPDLFPRLATASSNRMVPLKDGRCHWRSVVKHCVLAKRTDTGRYDRAVLRRVQKDV
jgi:hypothetical protein